MSRPYKRMKWI
uniref:Uncharacterized protein n=1 Tax=Rhizophora mucronata TaxID=61149 RepID=A0A2P2MLH1_RHIMU